MGLKTMLTSSMLCCSVRYVKSKVLFNGGANHVGSNDIDSNENNICVSDDYFLEVMEDPKTKRLTRYELEEFLRKGTLTKQQKLLKSVLDEAKLSGVVSSKDFQNLKEAYQFRRKYKNYLRLKRFVPFSMVGPFTGNELSKMSYASALGSKSIQLTLPGIIGFSIPAFYFFHMAGFYAPDRLKPACQLCKFTLGAPFWIAGYFSDGLLAAPEERFFGNEIPLDVIGTGGIIPADLGDFNNLREVLNEMKDFGKKTY